jgi:hypothetical protein
MASNSKADKTLQAYPVDLKKDDVHRVADYLFWASRKFPGRPVPLTYIVRVANAMGVTPRETNKQVVAFRESGRMGRVRQVLIDEYRCEMEFVRGVGYRATTDSNDIMDFTAEKRARTVRNAIVRMDRTMGLVKASEVTGKERRLRHKVLSGIGGQLMAPDIKDRLLLPDPDKDKDKKKGKK